MKKEGSFKPADFTVLVIANLILNGVEEFNVYDLNSKIQHFDKNIRKFSIEMNMILFENILQEFLNVMNSFSENNRFVIKEDDAGNYKINMLLQEAMFIATIYQNKYQIYVSNIVSQYAKQISGSSMQKRRY